MGILLALASSVLWGIADFAGGTASRRLAAVLVVLASQAAGLVAVTIAAVAAGRWSTDAGYLPWAVAAGLIGAVGLLAFYRALAVGTMGVVSPIAALGAVVPVTVGLATGHWPHPVVGVGFVLAVAGVVGASGPERAQGRSLLPVALAVVAAVCFGTTLLFIARGSAHSPMMTMIGMRAASVPLLAVVYVTLVHRRRGAGPAEYDGVAKPHPARRGRPIAGVWGVVLTAGVFDVAANLTFGFASTAGTLTIIAILGSLYPAVTVVLARIIHGELLTRLQQGGVAVTLVGVALITGWS